MDVEVSSETGGAMTDARIQRLRRSRDADPEDTTARLRHNAARRRSVPAMTNEEADRIRSQMPWAGDWREKLRESRRRELQAWGRRGAQVGMPRLTWAAMVNDIPSVFAAPDTTGTLSISIGSHRASRDLPAGHWTVSIDDSAA